MHKVYTRAFYQMEIPAIGTQIWKSMGYICRPFITENIQLRLPCYINYRHFEALFIMV